MCSEKPLASAVRAMASTWAGKEAHSGFPMHSIVRNVPPSHSSLIPQSFHPVLGLWHAGLPPYKQVFFVLFCFLNGFLITTTKILLKKVMYFIVTKRRILSECYKTNKQKDTTECSTAQKYTLIYFTERRSRANT